METEERECKEFTEYIQSEAYSKEKEEKKIVFMKKVGAGVHRGSGVSIFDDLEKENFLNDFQYGNLCNKPPENLVFQRYINNPMTVFDHKFDFRIYAFIASTNPLIVYYHDGFLRVSLNEFDIESTESSVHLTNTELAKGYFSNKEFQKKMNMTEEELRNFQMWNLTKYTNYLYEHKMINSTDWLDTYLRPKFKEAIVHLALMSRKDTITHSGYNELFGVDFMIDSDFKIWVIEVNGGPAMVGTNQEKHDLIFKMIYDMLDISMALLRSRIKRVFNFFENIDFDVASIHARDPSRSRKEVALEFIKKNKVALKKIFDKLNSEYFDEEYPEPKNEHWVKVMDLSVNNTKPYFFDEFPRNCQLGRKFFN